MVIVSYDISDNRIRAKFSKFLLEHGDRIQYSVYEIVNSERVLNLVIAEINHSFKDGFTGADSVIIFRFSERDILRFGNAKHREGDLLILGS